MSLPTNPKALDLSLLDSLMKDYQPQPSIFEQYLRNDPPTVSGAMLYRMRCRGCGVVWDAAPEGRSQYCPPCDYRIESLMERRTRRLEHEYQVMSLSASVSEKQAQAMAARINAEISASFQRSMQTEPSPFSTVPSSLSADSLMTRFSSSTSAKNSGSSLNGSKSGQLRLSYSPSKEIATKSSTPSSSESSENLACSSENEHGS